MAAARLEAEQLTQDLGREPSITERVLLEQIAYLRLRVSRLRTWGKTREADKAVRLLATLVKDFAKESRFTSSQPKLA